MTLTHCIWNLLSQLMKVDIDMFGGGPEFTFVICLPYYYLLSHCFRSRKTAPASLSANATIPHLCDLIWNSSTAAIVWVSLGNATFSEIVFFFCLLQSLCNAVIRKLDWFLTLLSIKEYLDSAYNNKTLTFEVKSTLRLGNLKNTRRLFNILMIYLKLVHGTERQGSLCQSQWQTKKLVFVTQLQQNRDKNIWNYFLTRWRGTLLRFYNSKRTTAGSSFQNQRPLMTCL